MTAHGQDGAAAHKALSNPFPGLRPHEPDEGSFFFGRDRAVGDLLERLRRSRLLAVVGVSGIGKSSLVQAGLLPALRGGMFVEAGSRWHVSTCRPGDDPVGNLARALLSSRAPGDEKLDEPARAAMAEAVLRRSSLGMIELARQARLPPGCNLLVVVERFGDLFRLDPATECGARAEDDVVFVRLLLEAARQTEVPVYVVMLLRAPYLGECARFWGLPEDLNDSMYLVPRLTRDEASEAITGPVRMRRAEVTPRLVQRLLNDLWGAPLRLPTFQHALRRTWDLWARAGGAAGPLDLCHYEATGGMAGALARHAEESFDELPDAASRLLAARLFGALVKGCRGGGEYGDIIKLKTLCEMIGAEEPDVAALVEAFRREDRSFLAPPATQPLTAESLVEISYDDLIHTWARLRSWAALPNGTL